MCAFIYYIGKYISYIMGDARRRIPMPIKEGAQDACIRRREP